MKQRYHVLNAAAVGAVTGGALAWPGEPLSVALSAGVVAVPVVLGALLPDVDCSIGRHRKTLHNLPVLGLLAAFPLLAGNLAWVWLGVLIHYLGDVCCSQRGLALLYPLTGREWFAGSLPRPDARPVVALLTAAEMAAAAAVVLA